MRFAIADQPAAGRSFAIDTHASRSFAYLVIEHVVYLHDLSLYVFNHQSFLLRKFLSLAPIKRVDEDEIFRSSPWRSSQPVGGYTSSRTITRCSSPIDGSRHLWSCSFVVRRSIENRLRNQRLSLSSAKVAILLGILGCLGAWFEKKILLFLVNRLGRGENCEWRASCLVVSVHLHDGPSLRCLTRRRRLRHRLQ